MFILSFVFQKIGSAKVATRIGAPLMHQAVCSSSPPTQTQSPPGFGSFAQTWGMGIPLLDVIIGTYGGIVTSTSMMHIKMGIMEHMRVPLLQ